METKRDFETFFRHHIMPSVREQYEQDGKPDRIARHETWIETIDLEIKNGHLPARAASWSCPLNR